MDTRKQELKRLKKERKRAKRRYVTLWKTFGILFLVLTLIVSPMCVAAKLFDNAIAAFFGGTFWELRNEDKGAIYYESDFATNEELAAYSRELCQQVEAEGAVLLMNENNALPLKEHASVSCLGSKDLKAALEKAGFTVNETLDSVSAYGDAAVVVLSQEEKELLQNLSDRKKAGEIQRIIVLISAGDGPQVDFLMGNPYGVDSVLWIGDGGITGADAVAEILAGKVNPSGSLSETFCYTHNTAPVMQSLSYAVYGGFEGEAPPAAVIHREGIYVGYKYYETRYEDYVMGTGNAGTYVYSDDVAYPFGFGLRYTTFAYSDMAVVYNETTDKFEVTVTVTNTGDTAGKETVQVYAQSPYTDYDKQNGVEKASVNLVGFGKTKVLAPGESESVTVSVVRRDLASFDTYGAKTYILDAGVYYLSVARHAHDAVNNILAAKGYTPETTENRMDTAGDAALTFGWEQAELDAETYGVSQNGTAITNQLSNADPNLYEGVEETVKWVSRQDWQGTLSVEVPEIQLTELMAAHLQDGQYNPADYPTAEMPTMGAENGLKLYDMIGLSFDDPKWQTLLDQLTFEEMTSLIGDAFYWQMPAQSVQAPGVAGALPEDGEFPAREILAATFNTELAYEVGKVIGNQCLSDSAACLYAPGGSDYGEDGFLAGKLSAAEVAGVQAKGVHVVMEFFAQCDLGKGQTDRSVWLNEQAARETYLRPIQYALEQNSSTGVITGNFRLGAIPIAGHKGLLTNILRGEWGGNGRAVLGNVLTAGLDGQDGVLAGATALGAVLPEAVEELGRYENDPVIVSAMRQACHYNLYTLANSSGMNGIGESTTIRTHRTGIVIACWIIAPVCAAAYIFFVIMWHRGKKKWKKSEAYLDYRTLKNTLKEEKKM